MWVWPLMRTSALGLMALMLADGCAVEGAVSITFLMPEDDNLSPVGTDLTMGQLTLTVQVPGAPPRRTSRRLLDGSTGVDVGTIPIANGVSIAVELRSPSQRLIGFGHTATPFDVDAHGVAQVDIVMRRPIAYVTGADPLATFDGALESTFAYRGAVSTGARASVVAPTHAGDRLVVATEDALLVVSTGDHTLEPTLAVPLALPPSSLAVTPHDDRAVVGHAGARGGISIIPLREALDDAAPVFTELGNVGAVAVAAGATAQDAPRVFALLDRAPATIDCTDTATASSIVVVALDTPAQIVAEAAPEAAITDIAVDPTGGTLALADPCADEVAIMTPASSQTERATLQRLRRPTSVAILDGRVWSAGAQPATADQGAFHVLGSVRLDGSNASVVAMPVAQEVARSLNFDDPGQSAEIRIDADDLVVLDMAVLPGAEHIALLSRGAYRGTPQGNLIFGPIIPAMTLDAWEYLLVDAASGVSVQRVRTRCDLTWAHNAFLDQFECATVPGQQLATGASYAPTHVAVLGGAR